MPSLLHASEVCFLYKTEIIYDLVAVVINHRFYAAFIYT